MRVNRGVWLLVCLFLAVSVSVAQSPNGTVSGIVLDPSGGLIVGADVLIINNGTGVQYPGKANSEGYYVVPNIPPGTYRIQVSNSGFKTIIKPDIVIHVEDALAINFTLPIGAASEIVTVQGGAPLVETENAVVSTVVDRTYVENMPLNGRSFQDLILLTPGTTTQTPQNSSTSQVGEAGEFSVNGQRTESNYYTVDGVSANAGAQAGFVESPSASGSLPASTALGTTQALVSVDALQEFRVQSSTYSAEYGRNPGGQFSFVTRSGTNDWHGTAFEYLRNSYFDANDWFNNYFGQPEPALRQNDFGGTLGGPVRVPGLYNGKDKTFFFFSYEGMRLTQPQASSISYVPDTSLRQTAAGALQPVLNAFPLPSPGAPDLGNGITEFIGTWSNPSQIDATSVRIDHALSEKARLFFRFSDTPSTTSARFTGNFTSPSDLVSTSFTTHTYTIGISSQLLARLSNELRFNYTSNDATSLEKLDSLGGARPVDLAHLQGINPQSNPSSEVKVNLLFGAQIPAVDQNSLSTAQRQWNLVDTVSISSGSHQIKAGMDYRRLAPKSQPQNPFILYYFSSPAEVQTNSAEIAGAISNAEAYPVYVNFSAFGQDEWRATSRLVLSFGLRWEVNPAPGSAQGSSPYTAQGSSLATLMLAPQGTPLWRTTWYNLAPRLGAAYILRSSPGFETVVRAGGGVFFDTGQQLGSEGYFGPGFSATNLVFSGSSFPVPLSQFVPTIINPPVAPYTDTPVYAFPEHLQLPYTLQWNVSVGQALGASQALTVSYVGANGRRLLGQTEISNASAVNPNFGTVFFIGNALTSSYNALQVQYQRRLAEGLQVLASYTFSHAIDFGSENSALPFIRGNSDFDVRHSLSGAMSYDLPNAFHNKFAATLLHQWGIDGRFSARTAFPVNLVGPSYTDPGTGQLVQSELNFVPGMPIYLYGAQFPGGREINPGAFAPAQPGEVGDAPRNFARGFDAWQMDLSVRRKFRIHERLNLQFRAEAFNIFNHPNFGLVNATYCPGGPGCTFGQATATLAQSLGILSPLYQMGGPRSMQFALKLTF